ncbi:NmrA family NAD(P)-binding protein [Myxococcota bacterium]|nr:NmrA family NAD(P)-binding protein [Myxococcota bacterium]
MEAPILVTGATGNVGREVVRCLVAQGLPVRAAARSLGEIRRVLWPDVDAVSLDFERAETFDAAVRGARGLFLLRPPAIARVEDTLNVLADRAVAAGVGHVVFLSVAGADRQRWVPHHAVERHLATLGAPATLLRAGFFAQNLGDAYRQDIRERGEIVVPAGRGRVAFVDVRDLAEVAALAFADASLRGQAWTLTGPEAVSFDELAEVLARALGREIRYVPASVLGYVLHLRRRVLPWGRIAIQTVLHVGIRFGQAEAVDPALERLLGRRPRTVTDYVRDHVHLWR